MIELAKSNPSAAQWSLLQYERLFGGNLGEDLRKDPKRDLAALDEHLVLLAEQKAGCEAPQQIAFLVAHRVGTEWELQNIAVSKALHRQGIGARLLSEFIAHARRGNATAIFLEVRESNHFARALYENAGFKEAGLRKNYYSNPIENAVLYRLTL
jgi:ribosomal-protein-alanine N-acetyltransferase